MVGPPILQSTYGKVALMSVRTASVKISTMLSMGLDENSEQNALSHRKKKRKQEINSLNGNDLSSEKNPFILPYSI